MFCAASVLLIPEELFSWSHRVVWGGKDLKKKKIKFLSCHGQGHLPDRRMNTELCSREQGSGEA